MSVCQNGLFTQFILIKGFCRWKSENSLICSTTVWARLSQFFKPNREQQPDPLVPFCEISVCLPPLGVSFPWAWDPRDQLWSHAGHTSVTQTLTKGHESVESTEITLRWWLTKAVDFLMKKWCPGAIFMPASGSFKSKKSRYSGILLDYLWKPKHKACLQPCL